MEGMLGQFGHELKGVSYFFCVFFLGNVRTIGISLVKKTQFLSLLPVSRRCTHYPSWLHHLVAYVVGMWEVLASCEQPNTALPCRSSLLLLDLAIFREVVGSEQAFPRMATISVSRVAPVAESGDAACVPTDAVLRQPDRVPAPRDCGRWPRRASSAQIVLEYADEVCPRAMLVCRSDSRAPD